MAPGVDQLGEPALTSAALARRLDMTPQSMSSLVRSLLQRGWVERPLTARRGQRIGVRLTETGRAVLERVLVALGDRPAPT